MHRSIQVFKLVVGLCAPLLGCQSTTNVESEASTDASATMTGGNGATASTAAVPTSTGASASSDTGADSSAEGSDGSTAGDASCCEDQDGVVQGECASGSCVATDCQDEYHVHEGTCWPFRNFYVDEVGDYERAEIGFGRDGAPIVVVSPNLRIAPFVDGAFAARRVSAYQPVWIGQLAHAQDGALHLLARRAGNDRQWWDVHAGAETPFEGAAPWAYDIIEGPSGEDDPPYLENDAQMGFDSRGRQWVVAAAEIPGFNEDRILGFVVGVKTDQSWEWTHHDPETPTEIGSIVFAGDDVCFFLSQRQPDEVAWDGPFLTCGDGSSFSRTRWSPPDFQEGASRHLAAVGPGRLVYLAAEDERIVFSDFVAGETELTWDHVMLPPSPDESTRRIVRADVAAGPDGNLAFATVIDDALQTEPNGPVSGSIELRLLTQKVDTWRSERVRRWDGGEHRGAVDIRIDDEGHAHIAYEERIEAAPLQSSHYPRYATW